MSNSPSRTTFDQDYTLSVAPDEIVSDDTLGIRKSNRAGLLIVLIIFGFAASAAGGYYYLTKNKETSNSQLSEELLGVSPISPAPAPVAIIEDPAADPVGQALKELEAELNIQPSPSVPSLENPSQQVDAAPVVNPVQQPVIAESAPPLVKAKTEIAATPKPKPVVKRAPKPVEVSKSAVNQAPHIVEEPVTSEQILIYSE